MINNERGAVFITVILVVAVLFILILSASFMIDLDVRENIRLKGSTQAYYLAEAGLATALASANLKADEKIYTDTVPGYGSFSYTVSPVDKSLFSGSLDRMVNSADLQIMALGETDLVEKMKIVEQEHTVPAFTKKVSSKSKVIIALVKGGGNKNTLILKSEIPANWWKKSGDEK